MADMTKSMISGVDYRIQICIILMLVCVIDSDAAVFSLGIYVPSEGPRRMGFEAYTAVNLTMTKINSDPTLTAIKAGNHSFNYLMVNSACEPGRGLYHFVEMTKRLDGINAVIGSRIIGWEATPAINYAMYRVNNDPIFTTLRQTGHQFNVTVLNIACDPVEGLYQFVELKMSLTEVSAIIGPYCDDVCTTVGLLAGRYKIPMITYGCESDELNDRELYPTFLRTTGTFKDMSKFLKSLVKYFRWSRITFVTGRQDVWLEAVSAFEELFEDNGIKVRKWVMRKNTTYSFNSKLFRESQITRVFILCAYGDDVIKFMYAANTLGINNGDYAFVALDYLDMARKMSLNDSVLQSNIFNGLLDITIDVRPNEPDYQAFIKDIKAEDDGSHGYVTSYEHSIHAALLADAILLYAVAVNATIANNVSPHNGQNVAKHLYGIKIQGISGNIHIRDDGSRNTPFLLHNIRNSTYFMIARSILGGDEIKFFENTTILWPGGKTKAPLGHPECGWDGTLCLEKDIYVAVGISLSVLFVAGSVLAVYIAKKRLNKDRLYRTDWKIAFNRLQVRESKRMSEASFRSSIKSGSMYGSSMKTGDSNDTLLSLSGQIYTQVAVLDGQLVAIKPILKPYLAVTTDVIFEVNRIRNLKYKTINQLIGACVEPQKICLVWAYCGKGSLQDVLQNDNIKLDWIFKISFISDIVRGMIFLHESEVECHGRLKSSNILVDNHWCCKVGDILMPLFRAGERTSVLGQHQQNCNRLWTAPEILRDPNTYSRGTKKGDVYSFAIILQEIILRIGPYGNETSDPEEIIQRVIVGENPPFRPNVPPGLVADSITDMMRSCWEENPMQRPTFQTIGEIMRKINKGKTTNIIDQMIHMLSKYADHLEDLVADRTRQLEEEQRKTDELLCRMLPKSIANDLKHGRRIAPDYFEACTVFFSDIVGFTRLASESTPLEIVEFLNDLYTTFDNIIDLYDVYKVETIGDAYMVASGLPIRNGNRHAGEIATMALDLLASMAIFTIKHRPDRTLQLRTGMHSGPVAAGVVGLKMPRYCLFGDTINYASRMESSGLALRIHVSPECKAVLDELGGFELESRGEVNMKGKGSISTFFLVGKKGFTRELPSLSLQAPLSEHNFK